jgi:hypothetical protein
MDVVSKIMEFYYWKESRGFTGVSARWNVSSTCRNKGKNFYFMSFYIILNLEVGRKPASLCLQ